jgi:hypothetical protein
LYSLFHAHILTTNRISFNTPDKAIKGAFDVGMIRRILEDDAFIAGLLVGNGGRLTEDELIGVRVDGVTVGKKNHGRTSFLVEK